MQLFELRHLLTNLDPLLQLGYENDTDNPNPINVLIETQDLLELKTDQSAPAYTIDAFVAATQNLDPQLVIYSHNSSRLYGFRQSNRWLLFK